MLSTGQFHKRIPRELQANLRWRTFVLNATENDFEMRQAVLFACKQDIIFWIDTFLFQINPDIPEKGPFIAWPYQEVAILGGETEIGGRTVFQEGILACVVDRKDVRWPKSRDGGASWIVLMTILWLCLFHENIAAGAISREEDAVDEIGNPNSLFEKVRIMLRHIPDWMKGGKVVDKRGMFMFPKGNTLIGSANVSAAFVGGRLTILLIDEFGQFDKNGEWIYDFTRDVCKCRVFVFTHKDQSGMAYTICYDEKFSEMREIVTHWSQHPRKNQGLYHYNQENNSIELLDKSYKEVLENPVYSPMPLGGPCPGIRSPWYDEECKARNFRDVSMNLDIDPRGAASQVYDTPTIMSLKRKHACPPLWIGDLEHTKEGKPIRLVENPLGLLKLWVHPMSEREMPIMSCGAGVDLGVGNGATPTCLSVGDASIGKKVAEYSNSNIYPNDAAILFVAICRLFADETGNGARLCWEIPGPGLIFGRVVIELGYRNVYWRRDEDARFKVIDAKMRPGWVANPKSIYVLHTEYKDALYKGNFLNHSEQALAETLNFVYDGQTVKYKAKGIGGSDASAQGMLHGDIVVADALNWMMLKAMPAHRAEKAKKKQKSDWLDPRTFDGRMKLAEAEAEAELIWE